MQTDSYLELALTLFAWDVSNKLTLLLIGTGLIFIPLAWLYWKNWSEPARSQEAKAAAPVSLRRMEQDIGLSLLVMLFAFWPAINISSANITYTPPLTGQEVNSNSVNIGTNSSPANIRVPVLWWIVIQFSSGFTSVFTTAIHSFESPQHTRALVMALDYAQIYDPAIRDELIEFDNTCYKRALNKLEQDINAPDNDRRRWRGDKFWMQNSNYYDQLFPAPPLIPSGWENQYSHPHNPGPNCTTWWSAPSKGLRDKLYDEIRDTIRNEQPLETDDFMGWGASARGIMPTNPSDQQKNSVVHSYLERKPPPGQISGEQSAVNTNIFSNLAAIGSLLIYPAVKATMTALIVALPMIQALILACIYIALPMAVPFAVVRPGVLVFFAAAIFSIKFLTGIWALAQFIDERLISMMYGGKGIYAGAGSSTDIILWLVAIVSYAGLPIVWLWLMSSFAGGAISGANSLFTHTATQLALVGQSGTGAVQSLGKLFKK